MLYKIFIIDADKEKRFFTDNLMYERFLSNNRYLRHTHTAMVNQLLIN